MKKLYALLLAVVFMASSIFSVSAAEQVEEMTLADAYYQAAWEEGNLVLGQELTDLDALMTGIPDGDSYMNNLNTVYGFYDQTIVDMWDYSMYLRMLALTGAQEIFATDSESYSTRADMFSELKIALHDLTSEVLSYYEENVLDVAIAYFQYGLLSDATDEWDYPTANMYRVNDEAITRTARIRVGMELGSADWDMQYFLDNMTVAFYEDNYSMAQIYLTEFEYMINELNGTTEEGAPLSYYSQTRNDLNDVLTALNTELGSILGDVYDAETYLANRDRIHVFMAIVEEESRAFGMRTLVSGLDLITEAINGGLTGADLTKYIEDIEHIQDMAVQQLYLLVHDELCENITDYCCYAMVEYCEDADDYWTISSEESEVGYDFRDAIFEIYDEFDDNVTDSIDAIEYAARYNKLSRALALTKLYRDEFAAELG